MPVSAMQRAFIRPPRVFAAQRFFTTSVNNKPQVCWKMRLAPWADLIANGKRLSHGAEHNSEAVLLEKIAALQLERERLLSERDKSLKQLKIIEADRVYCVATLFEKRIAQDTTKSE
jgi:hypothetical protein